MLTETIYELHKQVQVLGNNFLSATHNLVKLQKFVRLYVAVCTPIKLRKLVVYRTRVVDSFTLVESASLRKLDPSQ